MLECVLSKCKKGLCAESFKFKLTCASYLKTARV